MSGRPQRVVRGAEHLRRIMRDRGYNTVSLAAATGLSKQVIGYLASGSRRSCSQRTAEVISAALGVPEDVLFRPGISSEPEERR